MSFIEIQLKHVQFETLPHHCGDLYHGHITGPMNGGSETYFIASRLSYLYLYFGTGGRFFFVGFTPVLSTFRIPFTVLGIIHWIVGLSMYDS